MGVLGSLWLLLLYIGVSIQGIVVCIGCFDKIKLVWGPNEFKDPIVSEL